MKKVKVFLFCIVSLIVLIGSAAVLVSYQRDLDAARAKLNSLGSQVVETDCGTIEYARVGEGDPVLVLHGLMGGFDQGLVIAENLGPNYQAIAVSRFGYLRSPVPEQADFDHQADLYACLLDELNISKVAVLGTSGGANSAIRFAARYPERTSALVLLVPAAPGKVIPATPPRVIYDTVMRSDFLYWVMMKVPTFRSVIEGAAGVPKGFEVTPELQADVDQVVESTFPISGRAEGMIIDSFGSTTEFYEEISATARYPLSQVETPVLLICVLDDPNSIPENVKGLSELFPHARLVELPDGGHLNLGHEDKVKAEITQFLNSNLTEANSDN